jgi:hypothetical protein
MTLLHRFAALGACALVAACALETSGRDTATVGADAGPSPTGTPSGRDAASTPPPGSDASIPQPGSDASSPVPDDGAAPPPDDAAPAGDGSPVSPQCDQDSDGHAARGGCGGDDCCDTDSRAHPGVTQYFDGQDACSSFDYDCNGQEEQEFSTLSCQLDFFGGSCSGAGFDQATACGAMGSWTNCNWVVFGCTQAGGSSRVQGCR